MEHARARELISSIKDSDAYKQSIEQALAADVSSLRGRISGLFIYPIKGLPPIFLEGNRPAILDRDGMRVHGAIRDRMAMIVRLKKGALKTPHGMEEYQAERVSQKEMGSLARLNLEYDEPVSSLFLYSRQAPHIQPVSIKDISLTGQPMEDPLRVKLTNEVVSGFPLSTAHPFTRKLAELLSHFGEDTEGLRVLVPTTFGKRKAESHAAFADHASDIRTIFSDGAQLHVVSQSSLDWLNQGLKKEHGSDFREITHRHFRPNILVDGLPPNIEDVLKGMRVSSFQKDAYIAFDSLTPRCGVPQRSIVNGSMEADKEPNRWLLAHRPLLDRQMTFGINAHLEGSTFDVLQLGNEVRPM